jgi:hypothetical protein
LADGFPIWKSDGYEADDIIASAVNALYEPGVEIRIATSDKDLMQLVCDGVTVYSFYTGTILDEAGVLTKFGVKPSQMRDYLTLVGDSSDNIKGVAGIGAKRAVDLLQRFDSIDQMLPLLRNGAEGVTPAIKKSILESVDIITLARELVTMKTDAPIDFTAIHEPRLRAGQTSETDTMSEELTSDATIVDEEQKPQQASENVTTPSRDMTVPTKVDVEPFVGAWERQLEPRNPADARTIAKWLHSSRLFSQYGSPEAVFSIVLAGRELGLGTMASLRGFHVVEGKPTMAADLMRALVLASGKAEYFICKARTADGATWETKRKGDPQAVELTFTLKEAIEATLIRPRSAWEKHPMDMLAKTASAKLCRLVYSDVTFGLYATEELGEE